MRVPPDAQNLGTIVFTDLFRREIDLTSKESVERK
jgi:hypothetical protein